MNRINFPAEPVQFADTAEEARPDLRWTTHERNFACAGGARLINTIYDDAPRNHVIWQPDVYAEARQIADERGITQIIDVGCGSGEKLVHFFPRERFDTVGFDFHGSLDFVSRTYPDRKWVECDLTSQEELDKVWGQLDGSTPVVAVLSDVIEHLSDPRPVIAWLRTVLMSHPDNRLILSTPDRSRLGYDQPDQQPENNAHLREWTLPELECYCRAAGFDVVRQGYTRANQYDDSNSTLFVELACSPQGYLGFLSSVGLLHGAQELPRQLLVTSEYAGLHNTGGIGTFVAEQRKTYGPDKAICLFIGEQTGLTADDFSRHELVIPGMLIDDVDLALPPEDITLKAVRQLLFYFPTLSKVEYADYQGLGCRLAQAKRAGMFPQSLELVVHCHGTTHYLENAHQAWFGTSHLMVAEREKISIEGADRIVLPTHFLLNLYREIGIDIPDEKAVLCRYPYHSSGVEIGETAVVDTLVFFGKRSAMKGYNLFLGALCTEGGKPLRDIGIKEIVFIGPGVHETQETLAQLEMLRKTFQVTELTSLSRTAAMDAIRGYADRSLCVMPYLGDNHPFALLDVVFAGALPLMVRAGGVVELFPGAFGEVLLADATEQATLKRISSVVRMSVGKRHQLRCDFLEAMREEQERINEEVLALGNAVGHTEGSPPTGTATIIVPVFNTELIYLRELAFGINNQTMLPKEVIFVNDASNEDYLDEFEEVLRRHMRVPYRVITHPRNKGLAGARNTGLAAAESDYVINVDSDDVPLPEFVRDIVRTLDRNPRCAASVPYLMAFEDGQDFNVPRFGGYVYRPLGDGVIASQLDNNLGHANSGYRVSVLRQLGGWDESEKSMWEDWALYLRIVSSGYRIGVIPKIGCLYRVRVASMLRTYKVWPAMRRLARNVEGLPKFDSFRLQAIMRTCREHEVGLRAEVEQLRAQNVTLAAEMNRASVRATRSIIARLARYPRAYAMARASGAAVWRAARKVRNTVAR